MILFRKAKEQDIPIIREIAFKTWPDTYNALVGADQVNYMLEKMYNPGELLGQMLEGCVFLIAESGDKAIGFAAYDNIDPEKATYKLHKLYVLPEQHGTGAGKIIINEVVNQIKRLGAKNLQLAVNKKNKARGFYEHAGFEIIASVKDDIGNGYFMDDYIMQLKLS